MAISLIGYRGSGKSSVAPLLADLLQWSWIDADHHVEQQAGCTIREIFEQQGEAEFRRLERATMIELLQQPQLVIAAGGGAILHPQTRADMRASGPVVFLEAASATLAERLLRDPRTASQRPALTSLAFDEEIRQVLLQRTPLYRETATIVVPVDHRSTADITAEIWHQLPVAIKGEA
jgi:shikimate kinase